MSVVWMDGFAQYNDINDMQPHYLIEGASVADIMSILQTGGPRGNPCLQMRGSSRTSLRGLRLQLPAISEIIVGMNFMWEGFNESNFYSSDTPFRFYNVGGLDINTSIHVEEYDNTPEGVMYGGLTARLSSNSTEHYDGPNALGSDTGDSTSVHAIITGVWYYLEFRFKFADSPNGELEIRKDGETLVSLTGIDTSMGTTNVDEFWICSGNTSQSSSVGDNSVYRISDLHVIDATASPNDSFLYPAVVEPLKPVAEVSGEDDWIPATGTNNALMVDDLPHNFDSDFVSAVGIVANTKDRYTTTEELPSSSVGEVFAVQPVAMMRDSKDLGNQTARVVIKEGATEAQGATRTLTENGYQAVQDIFETNPDTGLPWTKAEVEASEFGQETI